MESDSDRKIDRSRGRDGEGGRGRRGRRKCRPASQAAAGGGFGPDLASIGRLHISGLGTASVVSGLRSLLMHSILDLAWPCVAVFGYRMSWALHRSRGLAVDRRPIILYISPSYQALGRSGSGSPSYFIITLHVDRRLTRHSVRLAVDRSVAERAGGRLQHLPRPGGATRGAPRKGPGCLV